MKSESDRRTTTLGTPGMVENSYLTLPSYGR